MKLSKAIQSNVKLKVCDILFCLVRCCSLYQTIHVSVVNLDKLLGTSNICTQYLFS